MGQIDFSPLWVTLKTGIVASVFSFFIGIASVSYTHLAGIMGAKNNSMLIPLCHAIAMTKCDVEFELDEKNSSITAICTTACVGKTGVEMEAMTGVSVALLTIYDMCKALDRGMEIGQIHLLEKSGGKSGHYVADHN